IKMDYPKTKWGDYIPWGDNNNCKDLCISFSNHTPPPVVRFIADVVTSPYSAPGKILYGKNFIFEDEEVTKVDRALAFLDLAGIGIITQSAAKKLGIKAMLVSGMAKTLATADVLNDIIN